MNVPKLFTDTKHLEFRNLLTVMSAVPFFSQQNYVLSFGAFDIFYKFYVKRFDTFYAFYRFHE